MNKKRSIIFLNIISFLDLLGIGILLPLIASHLRTLGASHVVIGFTGSFYSGIQVVSGPLIGSWSDVKGLRHVLAISLCCSCACYFLQGITASISFIILIRIILGCMKHTQTLTKASLMDIIPEENHTEVLGRLGSIGTVAFVIGPIIGGHVSELPHGYFYASVITSLLFLVAIGLLTLLPPQHKGKQVKPKEKLARSYIIFSIDSLQLEFKKVISNLTEVNWRIYGKAFAIRFLYGLSISLFFSTQSLYIQEKFGLSQLYTGYTISFFSAVGAVAGFSLGYITETFYSNDKSCSKRLLHFFIIITICYVAMYFAPNLISYLLLLIPFGVSSVILRIVSTEMMLGSEKTKIGSLSGVSNSIMSVSRFVAPVTSGVIGDIFGENSVMLWAGLPTFIALVLCTKLSTKNYVNTKQLNKSYIVHRIINKNK